MTDLDNDEVPPLEDMSEAITKRLNLRPDDDYKVSSYLETDDDITIDKKKHERITNMMESGDIKPKPKSSKCLHENKPSTFCGFKKGFLTKTDPEKKNKTEPKITEVKQKKIMKDKNVLSEVQDAMKNQVPLLQSKEWITPKLLDKILKNPKLAKQFNDPNFNDAITLFQTNPEKVMEMCKNNSELREFIQQFCELMGEHFTSLGTTQHEVKLPEESVMRNTHDASLKAILSDEEVVAALQTPEIQNLLKLLRTNPNDASKFLRTADSSLRQKIQKLVNAGLLQFTSG